MHSMYHCIHHMHDTCVLISHICQPCIPNDLSCPPYATWSFFSCLTVISTFGLVVGGGVYDLQFPLVSRIPDVLIMVQIPYFPFLSRLHFYVWFLPEFILLADSFLYPMLDFFTYHLWVLKSVKPAFFPVLMSLMTLNLVHNDKFNVVRGELQDHLEVYPGTVKISEKSHQPYSLLNLPLTRDQARSSKGSFRRQPWQRTMHKQEEKLSTLLKSMGYIDRGSIYSGWLTSLKLGTQMTEMIGEIKEKEEMKSGLLNVDKREVQMTNLDGREVESQLCKEGMCHELHRVVSHVTPVTLLWHILDPYRVTLWKSLSWLPPNMYIIPTLRKLTFLS